MSLLSRLSVFSIRKNVLTTFNSLRTRQVPLQRYDVSYARRQFASVAVALDNYKLDQQQFNKRKGFSIKDTIDRIERSATNQKRVAPHLLTSIMGKIQQTGVLNDDHALILIRSTGKLLTSVSFEKRQTIMQDIWHNLEKLGVNKSTQLFNAYLKGILDNKMKISPTEFLESMGDVSPNRLTYQLLIAQHCESGNMDEAVKMLEHMKEHQIAVNDEVFNSLISGYLRAGLGQHAIDTLNGMKGCGLEPTPDTYAGMLRCHAEAGDIEAMKKVIIDASNADADITSNYFLDVILELTRSGSFENVNSVIDLMPTEVDAEVVGMNTMYTLLANKYDTVAWTLFEKLVNVEKSEDFNSSMCNQYIKAMFSFDRPVKDLVKLYTDMVAANYITDDITLLPLIAMEMRRPQSVLEVMKYIRQHNNGTLITVQHVRSLLQICQRKEDIYEVINFLHIMGYSKPIFSAASLAILKLRRLGEPTSTLVEKLHEMEYPAGYIHFVQMSHMVEEGNFKEAAEFIKDNPLHRDSPLFNYNIEKGMIVTENEKFEELPLLYAAIMESQLNPYSKLVGIAMSVEKTLSTLYSDVDKVESYIQKLLDYKVDLKKNYEDGIMNNVPGEISEHSRENIQSLFVNAPTTTTTSKLNSLTVEELEQLVVNEPKAKPMLLRRYCENKQLENAFKLKTELNQDMAAYGSDGGPVLLDRLIAVADYKNDLDEALLLKHNLDTNFNSYICGEKFVLTFCKMLINAGRFEEAISELKLYNEVLKTKTTVNDKVFKLTPFSPVMMELCQSIMNASKKHATPAQTLQLLDVLHEGELCLPGQLKLLSTVIQAHLDAEDVAGAVSVFEMFVKKYKKTPLYSPILEKSVEIKATKLLKTVVDLLIPFSSKESVYTDLACALIHTGKVGAASKLFQSSTLKNIDEVILKKRIDQWVSSIEKMENYVKASKNCANINREDTLFHLIRAHCNTNPTNTHAALDVLITYESEGLQPKPRTLRYLANVCRSQNVAIPFREPQAIKKEVTPENVAKETIQDTKNAVHIDAKGENSIKKKRLTDLRISADNIELLDKGEIEDFFLKVHPNLNQTLAMQDYLKSRPNTSNVSNFYDLLLNMGRWATLIELAAKDTTLYMQIASKLIEQRQLTELIHLYKGNEGLLQHGCSDSILKQIDFLSPSSSVEVEKMYKEFTVGSRVSAHGR